MSDFLLPSIEEATIQVVKSKDEKVPVEVIDIYDLWKNSGNESDKLDVKDWIPFFIKNMKQRFDIDLSRTASVLLVEQAVTKLNSIKKSCSPELGE